jgi:hypothetical protein
MKSSRLSLRRRVLVSSLTWLFLGCMIGVIDGLGKGGGVQIFAMMIGGMTVLPIVGMLLGLVGGDPIGSVTGAAGGLLGCLGAELGCGVQIEPQLLSVILVFTALVGATAFLFMRFLIWKYGMMYRTICWLIGVTPVPKSDWAFVGEFLLSNRHTHAHIHNKSRPNKVRVRWRRLLTRRVS